MKDLGLSDRCRRSILYNVHAYFIYLALPAVVYCLLGVLNKGGNLSVGVDVLGGRDANTEFHLQSGSIRERNIAGLYTAQDTLGDFLRIRTDNPGKSQGEQVAVPPPKTIVRATFFADDVGNDLQDFIPDSITMFIIYSFEIVYIHGNDAHLS